MQKEIHRLQSKYRRVSWFYDFLDYPWERQYRKWRPEIIKDVTRLAYEGVSYQPPIKEAKMGTHLHKRFSVQEVKEIFERYFSKEIGVEQTLALLKIKRSGFFKLLKSYRETPDDFSLDYKRTTPPRKIDPKSEARIIKELKKEA